MDIETIFNGAIDEAEKACGRKILFAFLQGSQNYNLSSDESDIDVKAFCLPTIEDFYKGEKHSKCYDHTFGQITIHDIRTLPEYLLKANPYYIEGLFSKCIYINTEKCPDNLVLKNTEDLFNSLFQFKKFTLCKALLGHSKDELPKMEKGTPSRHKVFNRYGYDIKAGYHALRYIDLFFTVQRCILEESPNPFSEYMATLRNESPNQRQKLILVKEGKVSKDEIQNEALAAIEIMDSFIKRNGQIENQPVPIIEELKNEIRVWVESHFKIV